MCSRFNSGGTPAQLQPRFGVWPWPEGLPLGECRPTDSVLALSPALGAKLLTWGLPSPFDGKPLINARAETLREKPTFRPLLRSRVVVPAAWYTEWRKDGKRSYKNKIGRCDGLPMGFAGLTDGSFVTLITCAPAPVIAHIHGRMPVILDPAAERQWMDNDLPFDRVSPLLRPPEAADTLCFVEETPPPDPQMSLF
ncbi:SOS response-associated peptidase [Magnetospira thiophila]